MNDRTQRAAMDVSATTTTRRRLLGNAVGIGVAVAAIPAVSGVAAAHFPTQLDIDIQPQNEDNFIDLAEHDSVSVAVHPTEYLNGDGERETFDPTEEAVRYRFGSRFDLQDGGGARPEGDGDVTEIESGHGESDEALVLEFPVEDTGLDGSEEAAWLYWERDDSGEHGLAGVDSVRVYPGEQSTTDLLRLLRRFLE